MYSALRKLALVSAFLLPAPVLMGQVATGVYPYGTFDNLGFDTINVGNLNVHFAVQILNKAGRGMPFNYSLGYDSSIWTPTVVSGATTWQPASNWGWSSPYGSDTFAAYVSENVITQSCTGPNNSTGTVTVYSSVVFHDTNGSAHVFPGTLSVFTSGCGGYPSQGAIGPFANDGSGYQYQSQSNGTAIILSSNNTTYTVPVNGASVASAVTDSNGNEITVTASGYMDTTGNIALTVGGSSLQTTYQYTDTNGKPQTALVNYSNYSIQTNFNCLGIGEYAPTQQQPLISSISFPDGSAYNFTYEETPGVTGSVTGRIAGVQLPQGGWIEYTYTGGNNGIECTDGSAQGLTRKLNSDSGSATSTLSYSRTAPNGIITIQGTPPQLVVTSHTEVMDGLQNHKFYDFVEPTNMPAGTTAEYYETDRSVYQGPESGSPVVARSDCYNTPAPCTSMAFALPIGSIYTLETLDGLQTHETFIVFNQYGYQTALTAYDFGGAPSPGAQIKYEQWDYDSTELMDDEVRDGNGIPGSLIYYGYDEGTLTATTGVPNHVAVAGGRGNVTSINMPIGSGSYWVEKAMAYADTGTVLSTTSAQEFTSGGGMTPVGTTTMTYDPTYTYPVATTLPTPSSRVSFSTSATYDTQGTGLPTSSTDLNRQQTRMSYDSMLRPKEVDSPDGGVTTFTYIPYSATQPTQAGQQSTLTGGVSSDTETQYDGYGRLSRVAVNNGQTGNSWYQSDTCYDGNGNVVFQSYPYQGTGLGTGSTAKVCSGTGGDTYAYDVLGRITYVVRGNSEVLSYSYLGRATKSVDQNGVAKITQVDGLGRPTIVCELSQNSNMPGSGAPGSCGTDIAGTGFVTTYGYSNGFTTTTITQGGQQRIFQTDSIGRTTSVTEPERGITTYSYAYNSTGALVTRQRPAANQTNPSVLTTTTTQYDLLGRVLSISYSDGTPTKTFSYDANAGWGTTQTNLIGRLSQVFSSATSTTGNGAGTIYGYDPMGRIAMMQECLPSTCGTSANTLSYTYDLAGNLHTSTDGAGVTTTYTVSPAGELRSMSSSLSDATDPSNLISSALNSAYGPTSYSLGNNLSSTFSFDQLGRLQGGWVCSGSSSAKCAGGSQIYGFTTAQKGAQLTCSSDTALTQLSNYTYDEFNRLSTSTVAEGANANPSYAWTYDRWGNRLSQTPSGGGGTGSTSSVSVNTANNQIVGNTYDAAGNVTYDGFNTYTYDAEGNVVSVDNGTTATYIYNALNQRVQTVASSKTTEYVYNAGGQRVSEWNPTTHTANKGKYYWGGQPVAYYTTAASGLGAATHFEHQDWVGTERLRTSYNGSVEATFTSLPWGDGKSSTGSDTDSAHYAMLDHDTETDTDHAGFRQYSNKQGRFFSPDPYDGSYDMSNPQSMNRYVYAANSPLGNVDPSGADGESIWDEIGSSSSGCLINGVSGPCGMQYGPTFFGQPVSVYSGPTSYQSGGHTFTLVQGPDGLQWIGPAGQELSPGDAVEIGLPAIPVSTSFSDSFGISGGGTGGGGGSGDTSAQECEDKSNVVADSALYAGSRVHRLSQSNSQSCKAPSNPAPTPPKYGPQTPAQSQACHQFGVATAWTGAATVGTGTVGGILTLTGPGATVGVPLLFVSGAFGLTTATGTLIYAYVCQ